MKKIILLIIALLFLPTYTNHKASGISSSKAQQFFNAIQPLIQQTNRSGIGAELNNFMGTFDLKELSYHDPILVSSANGVGTKLLLAQQLHKHDTIGIDLVAMNINEILTQGAEPLFFLDYYAMTNLEIDQSTQLITGMAAACKNGHCALVGGHIAEIPGVYKNDNYNIAGFAIGIVEREQMLPKLNLIRPGDIIIGIASNGLHTSGFTELKNIIESKNIDIEKPAPFVTTEPSFGAALLAPTALYTQAILPLCKINTIKAIAHITEGGLNNIAHIIPQGVCAKLTLDQWYIPPVFRWIKHTAKCDNSEMFKVFNLGIGMVLIADADHKNQIIKHLNDTDHNAYVIGKIHPVDGIPVQITGLIKNPAARIMILGNSAREHALTWKFAQSPFVELVCVVNGNAGTFNEKKVTNIRLNLNHINGIVTYAQKIISILLSLGLIPPKN
jgi:phosphoribosylaminoimidazole synthetase